MRTIRTAKNREAFLAALSDAGGNVTKAAKLARLSRDAIYQWRGEDNEFALAWDRAVELGTGSLEDEAVRRAVEGTLKPVFQGGKKVGAIREYSDTLLIFMLKARRPLTYRERVDLNHSGEVRLNSLTDDQVKDRALELIERMGGAKPAKAKK